MSKIQLWVNLTGATAATPNIPGSGKGDRLERVTAAKNIASITDNTTVRLNSVASLAKGQLVITVDGYWGTIIAIGVGDGLPDPLDVRVDRWRYKGGSNGVQRYPAVAASALNAFPAGSCLADMQRVKLCQLIPTLNVTAVSATYILNHTMATATPVMPYTPVVGVMNPIELGMVVSSPFALQTADVTHFDCTLVFEPIS